MQSKSRFFALPSLLCTILHNQVDWHQSEERVSVEKQNFLGNRTEITVSREVWLRKRGLPRSCDCWLTSIQKNNSFHWNIVKTLLLSSSLVWTSLCTTENGAFKNQFFGGQLVCAGFWMLANAKSNVEVGSQGVYSLLSHPHPRSVPEATVCISYHRVSEHKHYSWLISHKSEEILFFHKMKSTDIFSSKTENT